MEKFTTYQDKATGISPFQPQTSIPTFTTHILHVISIPVKFLTFIPFILMYPIFSLLSSTHKVILDVLLAYFFNVNDVEVLIDGVRKSDEKLMKESLPGKNEIIFVNSTGPLDGLVFKMISKNPTKVYFGIAGNDGVRIIGGLFSWFSWCINGGMDHQNGKLVKTSLKELIGYKNDATVFIVPEGTLTNNKGILKFPLGFKINEFAKLLSPEGWKFKVMSVKVLPISLVATTVPMSWSHWLYLNFGSFTMNVKYKLKLFNLKSEDVSEENVRERLSNYGKLRILSADLDLEAKSKFVEALQSGKKNL